MPATSDMLRTLHLATNPSRLIRYNTGVRFLASKTVSASGQSSSLEAPHDAWRIRVFDPVRARSYAIDFGHFPDRWFLGPSTSVTLSRSDEQAGRPNSFKHFSKQVVGPAITTPDLSQPVKISASDNSLTINTSDRSFNVTAQIYGATLVLNTLNPQADNQISTTTALQHTDVSGLSSQTLRSEFDITQCRPNRSQQKALSNVLFCLQATCFICI